MTYRCDHIHLRSRDAVAAARFYVETLGAREIRRDGSLSVSRVTVDLGGLTLFIEQAPEGTPSSASPPHLGIEHIGLAVEDIDAAMAEPRRRNGRDRLGGDGCASRASRHLHRWTGRCPHRVAAPLGCAVAKHEPTRLDCFKTARSGRPIKHQNRLLWSIADPARTFRPEREAVVHLRRPNGRRAPGTTLDAIARDAIRPGYCQGLCAPAHCSPAGTLGRLRTGLDSQAAADASPWPHDPASRPGILSSPPRPLRSHQAALAGLVAAIGRGEADGVHTILAAVAPGGGKSLQHVIAAATQSALVQSQWAHNHHPMLDVVKRHLTVNWEKQRSGGYYRGTLQEV